MVVVVLFAFAGIVAFQLLATVKGWKAARHWRAKTSWRDLPMAARAFGLICVVGGLVGGVLLAMSMPNR
jgi:hypothetical protein